MVVFGIMLKLYWSRLYEVSTFTVIFLGMSFDKIENFIVYNYSTISFHLWNLNSFQGGF